jgi:ppGpp synthetase/RelA/SpoT-type nucleotidyltranferase
MSLDQVRQQHAAILPRAERLRETVVFQLSQLLSDKTITLGVPLESRLKTWQSISDKLERKALDLNDITNLDDLIGVRAILLFKPDLKVVEDIISTTFELIETQDKSEALGDSQFGYQSKHYIIRLPKAWTAVPSMADLASMPVEIQVRTLAQHIWAAASHTLQYKNEGSVPPPLRRALNRASALLETVDLEFTRLLAERDSYIKNAASTAPSDTVLNIDIFSAVLDEMLPADNKTGSEDLEELLGDLAYLGINTVSDLRGLLKNHRETMLAEDAQSVEEYRQSDLSKSPLLRARIEKGVFFTFAGLLRIAARQQFGEKYDEMVELRHHRKPLTSSPKKRRVVRRKPTTHQQG